MKKLLQLAIFLSCVTVFSQAGSLDTTFGTDGKVITSVNSGEDKARGVALQSDGKIVVAGYTFSNVFGYDFLCIRYNTDGSLDSTFGNGGITTFDLQTGSDDRAYSIDIQLDGKIVLAGFSDDGSDRNGAVIRLNTNGTLDSTFGTSGVTITNVFEADIYKVVKIHHITGNIVVGGTSFSDTNESNGILARYTQDGVLDTSFSGDGMIPDLDPVISSAVPVIELHIEDLAIKSNGRITAVGWVNNLASSFPTSDHYQCRINSNGTPDATFSEDGFDFDVLTTGWDRTFGMVLNPDDSFFYTGYTQWTSTDYRSYIADTPASGNSGNSVDTWLQISENTRDVGYGIVQDNEGNIFVGGATINNGNNTSSFYLSRASKSNNDITLDTSFGNSGFVTTSFGTNSTAYDIALQTDGKVILVGYTDNDIALARYGSSLSSSKLSAEKQFSVYPNPVRTNLTIDVKNYTLTNKGYKIYNSVGSLVMQGNAEENSINIEKLAKGFYILKLDNTSLKFIKE